MNCIYRAQRGKPAKQIQSGISEKSDYPLERQGCLTRHEFIQCPITETHYLSFAFVKMIIMVFQVGKRTQ